MTTQAKAPSSNATTKAGPGDKTSVPEVISAQQEERRWREGITNEMTSIFHMLDRLIMLMRVYPSGHPLIDHFAQQVHERLLGLMERSGYIYFKLDATELLTEWDTVFFSDEISERENFVWYTAAADGISSVQIEPEVSVKALTRFIAVINRTNLGHIPADDDTVTLLWEENLEHILTHAIEGFVDAKDMELFGQYKPSEVKAFVYETALDPQSEHKQTLGTLFDAGQTHLDPFTRQHTEASERAIPPGMTADMVADAFRVERRWIQHLAQEWSQGADLEYRLIEALVSIIRTAPSSNQSGNAGDTILDISTQLLDHERYDVVAMIVSLLRHRLSALQGSIERNPKDELLDFISDPMRVEVLIYQAQKQPEKRAAIVRLLKLLEPTSVQRQTITWLVDKKKEIVSLPTLIEVLFSITDAKNQQNLLTEELVRDERYLTHMLQGMRGQKLPQELHVGPKLFTSALSHDNFLLRRAALEIVDTVWCSPQVIDAYIEPLISDDDAQIRHLAIDLVRKLSPESFKIKLQELVEQQDFGQRSATELRYLLRLYLDEFPERHEKLYALIDIRGWLNEIKVEIAKATALVLLSRGDQRAKEILQRRADSLLSAPNLREEYKKLLERFGQAAAPESDEPNPQ